MRNWPGRQTPLKESLKRWINQRVLRLVTRLPRVKQGPLAELQMIARFGRPYKFERLAAPTSITLRPFCFTFVEFIFVDDFDRLKNGLKRLFRKSRSRVAEGRRIDELFAQDQERYGCTSWYNLGTFRLAGRYPTHTLVQDCHVELNCISPSIVCVAFHVRPTEEFHRHFQQVLSTNPHHQIVIETFSIFGRGFSTTAIQAADIRRDHLLALYLKLNKEVVQTLRKHVGVGWSQSGPLPYLISFVLEKGKYGHETIQESQFWSTLGMGREHTHYYKKGVYFFAKDRGTVYAPNCAMVIADEFLTDDRLKTCGGDKENTLFVYLLDELKDYPVLLALREQAGRLARGIAGLRKALGPLIAGKRTWWPTGLKNVLRIISLAFEHERVKAEVQLNTVQIRYGRPFGDYTRRILGREDDGGNLRDDTNWQIEFLWKNNETQLTVLKEHFATMREHRLARLALYLAFLAIVFAALAVPADVWKYIGNLIAQAVKVVIP